MAFQGRKFGIKDPLGEVIYEYVPGDTMLRLNLVHVATGVEVTVFGPPDVARRDLEQLGRAKLRYRLIREFGGGTAAPAENPAPAPKRGIVA